MSDCVFCKIGSREIPAMVVYENDEIVAFRDIAPKAPLHVIVMPRKHYTVLHECSGNDDGLLGRMLLGATEVVKKEKLTETGYRIVLNGGASQAIPHLHLHLLGGRTFNWPPG
jgi:histidine triad (HIT) family protein